MSENEVLLTEEGYKKLKEELIYLKGTKKMEVAEKIKSAREFGDLSENSEYDEAKNEQSILEAKIAELDAMIKIAKIIEKIPTNEVSVGVTVLLYDYEFDENIEYNIVGATEVDLKTNKISLESPVGRALFGRKVNDEIEVKIPDGVAKYKILSIKRTE